MKRRKFLISISAIIGGLAAGMYYWPRRWNYIVIHHSGGNFGTIEFLQEVHRQRQERDPIDAIPYHYVIGNGNGLGDGEIASDWRQKYNIWGAHLSAGNSLKNINGIGICLIGNFEVNKITNKQLQATIKLTKHLMKAFSIPVKNVTGHGFIHGENTKCPGKNFPMQEFISEIEQS